LSMAHEEMVRIGDLDVPTLENNKQKLWMFLAEKDDWVGSNKEALIEAMAGELSSIRIVHGERGIPHAYCINHSKELAEQCLQWLVTLLFMYR